MGGSLFKVERKSNEEFQPFIRDFMLDMFYKYEDNFRAEVVPYYSMKKDFGDADVVVEADCGLVLDLVNSRIDIDGYHINDGTLSIAYKGFQIDLICTKKHYDTTFAYYSYNDLGNLLGRIYHKFGLKYGHHGLLYPVRDPRGSVREEIVVCKNQEKILEFIGLNPVTWINGKFDTLSDIFNYVTSSHYFDRGIYDGEFSAINKKRDKKRKTFHLFLNWLEISQPESKYRFLGRDERDRYVDLIEEYFGVDINGSIKKLSEKFEIEKEFKNKFNGELVMELVDISGAQLGLFIGFFKKEFTNNDPNKFESMILNTMDGVIRNAILDSYKKFSDMKMVDKLNQL